MSTSSSGPPDPRVALFRSCRRALGMTLTELQVFLCLRDRVHLYRMEAGTTPIPGPVWVALRDRLHEEAGLDYLSHRVEAVLRQMREEVEERNLAMRRQQGQRRREYRRE